VGLALDDCARAPRGARVIREWRVTLGNGVASLERWAPGTLSQAEARVWALHVAADLEAADLGSWRVERVEIDPLARAACDCGCLGCVTVLVPWVGADGTTGRDPVSFCRACEPTAELEQPNGDWRRA